ncbi:HlyD family efflux transporter periplasmic adaptor subunit [Myxococcaceae bacterium GXIMD 01537]
MSQAPESGRASPFRKEALEYHRRAPREGGDVLRIAPEWTHWAYRVLLAVLVAAAFFSVVGTFYEYASGPALVRVEGRTDVALSFAGVVASVEVQPGQRVEAGQVLVRFTAEEEQLSLARMEREFELQLVRYLRDPADVGARQALTSLRAGRELAQSKLEVRTLRAPHAGIVGDVRIQPGQYLNPGANVLSLLGDEARATLLAFLPGAHRPLLRPGMPLRMELSGFPYEYRELTIESVGEQIVGPAEVRRFLGGELADAVALEGAVVLVRARLPSRTFVREGQTLNYFDGMPARAEARVRAESILVMLVPGLKGLFPNDG